MMFGGICWYCHWGWARPVAEIYNEALKRLNGNERVLEFGPAHVVWSDENWGDEILRSCLKDCAENSPDYYEMEPSDIAIVKWSLEELLKVPEDVRECVPADYDGEHPEKYPPTVEVMRVQ